MARILIVDDEPAICALMARAFKAAGYEVETALDGTQAVALCVSEEFDFVLSDVVMPSMSGHELVHWIAANCPNTQTALMSGADLNCDSCPLSTKCQVIAKPFRPIDVVTLVGGFLGRTSGGLPPPRCTRG